MQRKIGVTTWTFGNTDLVALAETIAQIGLDGVELYADIDRLAAKDVREIFTERGLEIFSLTPGNVDLASSDSNLRRNAIDYYKRLIDYGAELGEGSSLPIITCHEYIQNQMGSIYLGSLEILAQSCQEIAAHARSAKIQLGFEPLNRYLCRFILNSREVLALLTEINAANMTIILDAFHMNLEEDDPVKAILRCRDKLSIYQIADSNRQGIGFGHTNFDAQLAALDTIQYSGPIIIECAYPRQIPGSSINGSLEQIESYVMVSKNWLASQQSSELVVSS